MMTIPLNKYPHQNTREELSDMMPTYEMISDVLHGAKAVKAQKAKYLPVPSGCEHGIYDDRYKSYLLRALYYNITQPTRDALVGQIFLRNPMIDFPDQLKPFIENANGEGLSLVQLIKRAANYVLPYGRGGLLSDFPTTNGEVTKGQLESGAVRPIVQFYEPWAIRNWHVERVGNDSKLMLLVLDESHEVVSQDGYTVETKIRQKVYKLKNNKCYVEVFDHDGLSKGSLLIKAGGGSPLDYIPFEFIGSENNDADIDEPPFYNLAELNLAHYRNSADYEDSVFLVGQPTPVYSGLTEDWVNNHFDKGIPFGSRVSIPLPQGAKAELLQAQPNMLAFEAMTHKEEQMIAIGAKIINPKRSVERKEAEIEIEAASQRSVLTTIKDNLQDAFLKAIKTAASFVNIDSEQIKLTLNDNFDLRTLSAEQMRFLTEIYSKNGIAFSEYRENLRRSGIAKMNDEEAIAAIRADQAMKKEFMPVEEKPDPANPGNKVKTKSATKSPNPVKKNGS